MESDYRDCCRRNRENSTDGRKGYDTIYVFAICDYRLQNMQNRESRHLYDIAKLVPIIHMTPELGHLVTQVRMVRMNSKNNPSAQPEYDIPGMLQEIIDSRFFESDYKNITKKLLYEDVAYEEAIKSGIAIIAASDLFVYENNQRK